MGLRFRKSIKLAPGLKLNINKKSIGLTTGVKGAHFTLNSKGKKTASVGIPGTGLYYTKSSGGSSRSPKTSSAKSSSGNSNGGGCLLTCLKILGIIILLPVILGFGWIAGIVWLIFFRNKVEDSKKREKYTTYIIAATIVSFFIFMISIFMPHDTTSTGDTTPSEISSEVTETTEVLDSECSESETTESSDISTETETVPTETQEPIETPNEVTNESTSQPESESTSIANTPETTNQQEVENEQSASTGEQQELVWVDDTAKRYHRKSDCSGMDNAYQVTKDEAINMGKTPCGRCYR